MDDLKKQATTKSEKRGIETLTRMALALRQQVNLKCGLSSITDKLAGNRDCLRYNMQIV